MILKGCITHKIFSNDSDYHILALTLIGNEYESEEAKRVLVFKDWMTEDLPLIGEGEWIEVGVEKEHHPKYGEQMIVKTWDTIDHDAPKPKPKTGKSKYQKEKQEEVSADEFQQTLPLSDTPPSYVTDVPPPDDVVPVKCCPHCGGFLDE